MATPTPRARLDPARGAMLTPAIAAVASVGTIVPVAATSPLVNPASGRCPTGTGSGSASTHLHITDCAGAANQTWKSAVTRTDGITRLSGAVHGCALSQQCGRYPDPDLLLQRH